MNKYIFKPKNINFFIITIETNSLEEAKNILKFRGFNFDDFDLIN